MLGEVPQAGHDRCHRKRQMGEEGQKEEGVSGQMDEGLACCTGQVEAEMHHASFLFPVHQKVDSSSREEGPSCQPVFWSTALVFPTRWKLSCLSFSSKASRRALLNWM